METLLLALCVKTLPYDTQHCYVNNTLGMCVVLPKQLEDTSAHIPSVVSVLVQREGEGSGWEGEGSGWVGEGSGWEGEGSGWVEREKERAR